MPTASCAHRPRHERFAGILRLGAAALTCGIMGIPGMGIPGSASAETLKIQEPCLSHLEILGTGSVDTADSDSLPTGTTLTRNGDGNETLSSGSAICPSSRLQSGSLHVPRGTDIIIQSETRSTDYAIKGVEGALTARLNRGELRADTVSTLDLITLGHQDITIGQVTGKLSARLYGAGDLTIDKADLVTADIMTLVSGTIRISEGNIRSLVASTHGSGDIESHVTAHDATLSAFGSGDIVVDLVSGSLTTSHFGSGEITAETAPGVRISGGTARRAVSSHASHDQTPVLPGYHLNLSLLLLLIVTAIVLGRCRKRKNREQITALPRSFWPQRLWEDASNGYTSFVNNWEQRMAEQRARPARPATPNYTRQAVDFWEEIARTARDQRKKHREARTQSATIPDAIHPLTRLQERLTRLEPRLAQMEQFVTSPHFALERQFLDLERS